MKLILLASAACLAASMLCVCPAGAQATPAATKSGALQAGITYTNASTDLVTKRIGGISAYANFDLHNGLGLELDLHFPELWTPDDFAERSYMAGIRYSRRYGRYQPYVKGLGGIAQTIAQRSTVALPHTPEHFAAYAVGGGLDLRLTNHINVRAIDYEKQFWPGFSPNGLTPGLLSAGVAYRFR